MINLDLLDFEFPEIQTSFGNITFEYLEEERQFIVSFKPTNLQNTNSFLEGSIFIKSTEDPEECKRKFLTIIQDLVNAENKDGAELQSFIVTQLHKSFESIEVDDVLQPQES